MCTQGNFLSAVVFALLSLLRIWFSFIHVEKLNRRRPPHFSAYRLFMPTTLPGLSIIKSAELLQMQDRIIKALLEVASVFGRAGRAQTATDPAPTEMFETVVNLKSKEQWRPGVTTDNLMPQMNKALQFPGVSNA